VLFLAQIHVFESLAMSASTTCLVADDDPMSLKIIESFIQKTEGLECVAFCPTATSAATVLQNTSVDILFLDVEMPEMTGIELLKSLPNKPFVVLISSKEDYAASAFDLDVVDYLVKPMDYVRFLRAYHKVLEAMRADEEVKPMQNKLFVKADSVLLGLDIAKIAMVEAMADYVRIYVGDKRHTVYSSMKGIEAKLGNSSFIRVHRSYIVNLAMIDSVEDNTITVAGHLVPVGVTYQKALMGRLNLL
jgi:two-component system, LytTR family, response regulator